MTKLPWPCTILWYSDIKNKCNKIYAICWIDDVWKMIIIGRALVWDFLIANMNNVKTTAKVSEFVWIREVVKKTDISECLPPRPSYSQFFVNIFWVCFFILDYDSMCSEMDFTPKKSFSFSYKNSQLLRSLLLLLLLCHKRSDSRGVKGIKNAFLRPLTMR